MQVLDIILITIGTMLIIEGLFFSLLSGQITKTLKKLNAKNIIKLGLIEIIIALIILFLVAV